MKKLPVKIKKKPKALTPEQMLQIKGGGTTNSITQSTSKTRKQ